MTSRLFKVFLGFCLVTLGRAAELPQLLPADIRLSVRLDAKTHFRLRDYSSLDEWDERRQLLRKQILVAAGLDVLPSKQPLNVQRFGRQRHGNYIVEKVLFESLPGYFVAGNLYLPVSGGKHPAVLVPHGHWKNGRIHNTSSYSVPALCANLAAQGFVAFAYDMVGYNDTTQTKHIFGSTPSEMLWSFSPLGLQLWNSIRALDLLESLTESDPTRLGVTGASGGATQTILLAAVDDRIKASAPVDMVSANFQGDDACEIAPGLRDGTNNVEIASLMAPKPMLLVSATGDWTKHTPMVELPAVTSVYKLYGHPEAVSCAHIHSPHNYNEKSRVAVYAFFRRYLMEQPFGGVAYESEPVDLRPTDLLIGAQASAFRKPVALFDLWKSEMRKLNSRLSLSQMRDRLAGLLGSGTAGNVTVVQTSPRMVLQRTGSGERVSVQLQDRPGNSAIAYVGGQVPLPQCDQPDTSQLAIEVFQSGSLHKGRSMDPAFLTYQRSDDSNRVRDILTSLAYLKQTGHDRITLDCTAHAAGWCMLAAAISSDPVSLKIDGDFHAETDEELSRMVFVPGLQHAGGMDAVRALLSANQQLALAH